MQVCEDYRHREHSLQPTSLRPDFEIIPDKHLKEGARILAPHSDGLWYSARIVSTSNDVALRARNKLQVRCCWHAWLVSQTQPRNRLSPMNQNNLQVKFDEYQELYTVPLKEVIPRVSTHEQNDDADIAAVYKRRRREDKERAARDAAHAGEDEGDEESSNGVTICI